MAEMFKTWASDSTPPSLGQELEESQFSDGESQVPTDWEAA